MVLPSPNKLAPFSKEQQEFLFQSTARQNLAHGPVRSGKNFVINLRFDYALKHEPFASPKSDVFFSGKSKSTVYRVFLRDLFELVGKGNYTYNKQEGIGRIYDRDFFVFGYSDSDSHEKISGATGGLGYITEAIYCNEDFYNQHLARLSEEGAMLFADTNPAGPQHYIYKRFINNQQQLLSGAVKAFGFNFDSNLSLDETYKNDLKRDYGPGTLWYQRMIEGKWVMADGIIYQSFIESRNAVDPSRLPHRFENIWVGVDFGMMNPFVFLLIGEQDGKFYLIKEWYYCGRDEGQKTVGEYADEFFDFVNGWNVNGVFIDPSATAFITELESRGYPYIEDEVDNTVIDGIKTVESHLHKNELIVSKACTKTIEEFGSYIWDANAAKNGTEKPKKQNDHCMDALRYPLHSLKERVDHYSHYGLSA